MAGVSAARHGPEGDLTLGYRLALDFERARTSTIEGRSWKTARKEIEPMFPDPTTTRVIHDAMIAEELARRTPDHQHPDRSATIRLPAIRHAIARTLVRLADRIAPAQTPSARQPA
jgi:hypothetical protein